MIPNARSMYYNEGKPRRIRFGFGEYNSETYGKIAYFPVVVLSHLAPDEDIRAAAEGVRQAVCRYKL